MAEDSVASVILAVFIPLFFVLLFAFGPYLLSAVVGTFHQRGLQKRLDIRKQVTLSSLPIDPIHSLSRPANVNRPIQGSGPVMANPPFLHHGGRCLWSVFTRCLEVILPH